MNQWAATMNRRQAAGQCRLCSKPQRPGRVLCKQHLEEAAARRKRIVEARKAAGVCVEANCGLPPRDGGVRCESCAEAVRIYHQAYRRKRPPAKSEAA